MTSFIKENERKIKDPASQMANNEFNSFYDTASKPLPFLDFNQLAHDLTNTRLGTQKNDVDWEKLYKDVGLSQLATETAKKEQLRFYNIMAGVYGKNNILRLMQSVTQAPISNKNVVAYNQYSYLINSQRQIYGPDFVNTKEISANYQAGWWATNNIISVSTHEYGHAFDNFLSLTDADRSTFNNNWNWPKNNKIENCLFNKNIFKINNDYSSVWRAQNHVMRPPISDCSQLLMDYLNDKVNISNSDYQKRLVFPMIIVQSNYGRMFWSETKPYKKGEFFAEAFAEWLLTPQSGREWNWELLNDFFIKKLPTYL